MKKRWMKRRRVKLRIRQRRPSIDKDLTKEEGEGKVFVSFIFKFLQFSFGSIDLVGFEHNICAVDRSSDLLTNAS